MTAHFVTAEALETAIAQLPAQELAKFRHWFTEFDSVAWDRQLEADAHNRKLDALAAEALEDYRRGKATEL